MKKLPSPILGQITAFTISTPSLERSLAFYQMLGYAEVMRADWPFPWIQVSDGVVLIMLREGKEPYMALTYYIKDAAKVVKMLEGRGIQFMEKAKPKDMVKRYLFRSPDGVNISLVGITDGFSQPKGPGMLQMAQEDYFRPEKYVNQVAGLYGEYAHPVKDLKASIAFWELLGFQPVSEFTSPYPWAILSDGLAVVGLHQSGHFDRPAITYFAADMRQKIAKLKAAGLSDYTEQGPSNIVVHTPEGQQVFLFQLGQEPAESKPVAIAQVVLETERLLLKEITPEIMTQVFTQLSDAEAMAFLGLTDAADLELEKGYYRQGLSWYRASSKNFILFGKESGERLGRVGFHTWYQLHARAEIGYDLAEAHMRQGYMAEALAEVIRYGFEEMKLNRIEALVGPGNVPSLKLMERFGFTKEGVLRSHYFKNGKMEDSVCFGLLRDEYKQKGQT